MIIDLRSDTVTKPSPEMLEAMFNAQVGDDIYDEDPTANELQTKVAKLFLTMQEIEGFSLLIEKREKEMMTFIHF